MADLDIVGTAAVDIVPIAPTFHTKLQAIVVPSADRVGDEAGRKIGDAIGRQIAFAIPNGITAGGNAGQTAARRQGNDVGGAFARSIKNRLEIAFRSLPKADVRLGDTGFNADLARLRARMETLSRKTIGVDLDAGAALVEIQAIDAKLAALGADHADVNVRADTASARAELAAIQRQINDVDRDDVNIKVRANTASAQAAIFQLAVSVGILAALPVIPVAAAGIGAIASAAVVATAGVGALALAAIPAIKGVTSVIQAKTAADKEAASATDNSAAANVKAAQSALQMASAQAALTSAHRNAARSIAQANRQVEDANRAVGDAERAVADAAQRAAEQRRQAAESIERSERSLSDAKRQARQAEEDLTRARFDAAQQLADLNDQLERGKLDERDATLRVTEAQEELNRVQAEYDAGKATELQLQRAQLAFDQSTAAAKQQQKDFTQLQKDAEAAKKAGVDGNADVKRATDQVADAQRNVQDQTKALADARRDAARAETESARAAVDAAQKVSDAQRAVADAVSNAADVQVKAAESIASAERGVQSARLSGVDTTTKAVTKADEYRKALANLTPEQRDLYDSIAGPKGLTAAYKAWSLSLQPDVLPLFTRAVDGAKRSLPGLSPLVRNSADAVGELMDRASRQLKNPFWTRFKKGVNDNAKPAIVGLGVAFGNVFKGMAGVVDAFFPHMDSISDRMGRITGRFADWGTGLRGSPEFEKFLDYASERSPLVGQTFGDLAESVLDLSKALEPFSKVILELLSYVADAISYVAEHAPWAIQLIYGLWVATKLWTIAMAANPIGLVVLGLVALALAVKYAWDHFEWFRDAVTGTWKAIQTAATFAWTKVLDPVFTAIWGALKWVGAAAVWLWQNVFGPVFRGIWLAARIFVAVLLTVVITPIWLAIQALGFIAWWLWTDGFKPMFEAIAAMAVWVWQKILEPVFGFIWDGIKLLGAAFLWLYDHAVAPSLNWIATKAKWLWRGALAPALGWIWDGLKWIGGGFKSLYDHTVRPVFDWIAEGASWLYEKGLKPAFDNIKSAVSLVGDAFKAAKKTIKTAWDSVAGIASKPVNFIVEWVYTKGIKAVWDKVASFVGLGKLPAAPKLLDESPKFLEAGGTVGNGWGVAAPMKTNRPTAIVGEGNPRYPEYVIPTDPKYRARSLALHRQAGTQLLESGGVLGGVWDWTRDTVSDVIGKGIDWAKTGADLLGDPSKVWNKLTSPVLDKVADGVGTSPMGKVLTKIPSKMVGGLRDKIVSAASSLFSGGGGAGVGQWLKPVNAAYGTRFGVPGSMWSSGHHTGLDFPAPTGTRVNAVANGQVTGASSGGPYGNHVTISHGGGLSSLYAHLSQMMTSVGNVVKQGQEIGKVGSTGNTTGPHLHLEARLNGRSVDPMPFLTGPAGGFNSTATGAAQQYAKSILGNYGWGPSQFGPLKELWNGESGWRWNAENPSSGAYGIPQALPASKMASAGSDWRTNAGTQIRWGLDYIKDRPDYGSPSAAYSKWLSRSPRWYDDGGYIPPGLSLVANGTGKPEPVFTSQQWDTLRSARTSAQAPNVTVESHTYLGTDEITDILDHRIVVREQQTATDINSGRYI